MPKLRVSKKKRSFVQDWKMADLVPDLDEVGHGRNFAQGQDAVFAVQCLMCHRMGDEGGSVGPELTAVASRFSRKDILESILEPSKVISEQYANTDIGLKNGDIVSGRVVSETPDKIVVRPSMLAPDMQEISKADIKSRELSEDLAHASRPREYPDQTGDPRSARLPRIRRPAPTPRRSKNDGSGDLQVAVSRASASCAARKNFQLLCPNMCGML